MLGVLLNGVSFEDFMKNLDNAKTKQDLEQQLQAYEDFYGISNTNAPHNSSITTL